MSRFRLTHTSRRGRSPTRGLLAATAVLVVCLGAGAQVAASATVATGEPLRSPSSPAPGVVIADAARSAPTAERAGTRVVDRPALVAFAAPGDAYPVGASPGIHSGYGTFDWTLAAPATGPPGTNNVLAAGSRDGARSSVPAGPAAVGVALAIALLLFSFLIASRGTERRWPRVRRGRARPAREQVLGRRLARGLANLHAAGAPRRVSTPAPAIGRWS